MSVTAVERYRLKYPVPAPEICHAHTCADPQSLNHLYRLLPRVTGRIVEHLHPVLDVFERMSGGRVVVSLG